MEVWRRGPQSGPADAGEYQWGGVISLSRLIGRDEDLFSGLGGITLTVARFSRLPSYRGLPPDISREAGDDYLTSACVGGETWIGWPEITAIDWEEGAFGDRPRGKVPGRNGPLAPARQNLPGTSEDAMAEQNVEVTASVDIGSDLRWREPRFRLRRLLFRLMEDLADEHGRDGVRLVVWFDC